MPPDYRDVNRANWDARVPVHLASGYGIDALLADPDALSDVVRFDRPRLGDLTGLDVVHLQCHLGTDTLSLARLGAASVAGVDLSGAAIEAARDLAARAGTPIEFVQADVYDAESALGGGRFDLVYTGIGALCWLPDIARWARTVASLLRPGGRLFVRDAHPVLLASIPVEGRGRLALPSFADVHVHLDSTRLGLPFRPHTGAPGVWAMMLNDRRNWRDAEASITERTTTTLGLMIARGTTAVRSYAQVDVDCGLERLDAVLAARDAHAGRADVQVIAFPQAGLLRESGSAGVLAAALENGADVVGGIDPCSLDRDPVKHLDIVFGLAERFGVPIDIHLHEPDQLAKFSTELILERIRALDLRGRVTISHGYGLAKLPESELRILLEQFREWDVAMATVAPPTPLPTLLLAEYGVRLGLGEDGQRDYWSPYGNADLLDRTWQLAFTNGFRQDRLIEHCVAIATRGGRAVIGSGAPLASLDDRPGVSVGDRADLVLVSGDTVTAAVMDRPDDRTVLHRGRVVADDLQLV